MRRHPIARAQRKDKALTYRERCGVCTTVGGKLNIAINDYSQWICRSCTFRFLRQNCIGKTAASYGVGRHVCNVPPHATTTSPTITPTWIFPKLLSQWIRVRSANIVGMID